MNLEELLAKEVPEVFREGFIDYDKEMEKFASEIINNNHDCVKISDIVGCNNKYECNSWYEVFNNAKRMPQNLDLLRKYSSEYYHSSCKKDDMSYIAMDGKYFVDCGKHRTCIAKALSYFDGLEFIRGVTTTTYKIDYKFKSAYEKLIELNELKNNKKFWKFSVEVISINYDSEKEENNGIKIERRKIYAKVNIREKFVKWYLEDINRFLPS